MTRLAGRITLAQSHEPLVLPDRVSLAWDVRLASSQPGDGHAVLVILSDDKSAMPSIGPAPHLYTGHLLSDTALPAEPPDKPSSLYLVAFAVPDSDVATLEDWYAAEHVPQMMTVPGWRRIQCVRVDSAVGGAFTHLALHWIDAPAVLETQARKTASLGPKRNLIAHREWFAKGGRWIYEPLLKNGRPAIG